MPSIIPTSGAPKRAISFEEAKSAYVHRFTMQHVPAWAKVQRDDGTYYAPQYRSDREWYDSTIFPGEPGHFGRKSDCMSRNPSWPLGQALAAPYRPI